MPARGLMQIGEVAEHSGLSLRTIRYYEEVGLVVPATRSQGGFRLYTRTDLQRLQTIKRMKVLDFSLDQMRELLDLLDHLAARPRPSRAERARLLARLDHYRAAIRDRCEALREQLATAETFDAGLARHADALSPELATTGRR